MPWMNRAPTRSSWLCAKPQTSEAARKIAIPYHEDVLAAQKVAEAPGEEQEPAEGDQVAVDDPREAGLAEAEVLLDGGQRDVDHRHVEDDHQEARAQDVEGEPAVSG